MAREISESDATSLVGPELGSWLHERRLYLNSRELANIVMCSGVRLSEIASALIHFPRDFIDGRKSERVIQQSENRQFRTLGIGLLLSSYPLNPVIARYRGLKVNKTCA